MTLLVEPTTIYGLRRERARELGARFDFAQQQLALYLAVVDTQERVFERARADRPSREDLAAYVVRVALPGVMEAGRRRHGDLARGGVASFSRSRPRGADRFLAPWRRGIWHGRFPRARELPTGPRGATGPRHDAPRRDRRAALPALRWPAATR